MIHNLTEWSLVCDPNDGYKAPEQLHQRLSGKAPTRRKEQGKPEYRWRDVITTSHVVGFVAETGIATTASGTQYRLVGPPSAPYAAWCANHGHDPLRLLPRAP